MLIRGHSLRLIDETLRSRRAFLIGNVYRRWAIAFVAVPGSFA